MVIFEIAKNGIWSKKFFREIDLFDSTSFFGVDTLAWTFFNFLDYCGSGSYLRKNAIIIPRVIRRNKLSSLFTRIVPNDT